MLFRSAPQTAVRTRQQGLQTASLRPPVCIEVRLVLIGCMLALASAQEPYVSQVALPPCLALLRGMHKAVQIASAFPQYLPSACIRDAVFLEQSTSHPQPQDSCWSRTQLPPPITPFSHALRQTLRESLYEDFSFLTPSWAPCGLSRAYSSPLLKCHPWAAPLCREAAADSGWRDHLPVLR